MRKLAYTVWNEEIGDGSEKYPVVSVLSAYNHNDEFIGAPAWAEHLAILGIAPEIRQEVNDRVQNDGRGYVCSIGFNEKEQTWYGFVPGKILGFKVRHKTKLGDVAFIPSNFEEYKKHLLSLYDMHPVVSAVMEEKDDALVIHYEVDLGEEGKERREKQYPKEMAYGRGEWTAETLEDAREMAADFARGLEKDLEI